MNLKSLKVAGLTPKEIAIQTGVNHRTVSSYLYRKKLVAGFPPRITIRKGYFKGRIPGIIRRYLVENPLARVDEIIATCDLTVNRTSVTRYLNNNGLQRTKAKRNIFLSNVNKGKTLAFAQKMLAKVDEYFCFQMKQW